MIRTRLAFDRDFVELGATLVRCPGGHFVSGTTGRTARGRSNSGPCAWTVGADAVGSGRMPRERLAAGGLRARLLAGSWNVFVLDVSRGGCG